MRKWDADQIREEFEIPGCRALLRRDKEIRRNGELLSLETQYFLSSLNPDEVSPSTFQDIILRHWEVENCLHWQKDRQYEEDKHVLGEGGDVWTVLTTARNGGKWRETAFEAGAIKNPYSLNLQGFASNCPNLPDKAKLAMYPLGESNPCYRTENPVSLAARRRGHCNTVFWHNFHCNITLWRWFVKVSLFTPPEKGRIGRV